MLPGLTGSEAVTYLEELFKGWVHHRVWNKWQRIEREELCGLAQSCPFALQVGFEIRNPFIQFLFVLRGREDARLRSLLDASPPSPPSTPASLSSLGAGSLPSRPGKCTVSVIVTVPAISPLHETVRNIREQTHVQYTAFYLITIFSHPYGAS